MALAGAAPAGGGLLLLSGEGPLPPPGPGAHPQVASWLPAQGMAAGGRHVRPDRWNPAGAPVHRLLLAGQPGPRLRPLHLLLRLHHLRRAGHLQAHLCGHLRGSVPAGGAGRGPGVSAGGVPDGEQRQPQRRPAGRPGEHQRGRGLRPQLLRHRGGSDGHLHRRRLPGEPPPPPPLLAAPGPS